MKLALVVALAALGLASAAQAATLAITTDQPFYDYGDTVTLTVTGDSQGASALSIFGRLNFSGGFQPPNLFFGTPTQTTLVAIAPSVTWTPGPIFCNVSSCEMMNQLSAFGLSPAPATNLLVSTVQFLFYGGDLDVRWETNPATGFQLDFFGLTNAPGITIREVPEPATALLLGLGLAGLAAARRRS